MSINKCLENLLNNAVKTKPRNKLVVGYSIDVILIFLVLNILGFVNENYYYSSKYLTQITLILSVFCFPIYYYLGYYSTISRYINSTFCYKIFYINLIFVSFIYSLNYFLDLVSRELVFWIFFWFLLSTFSCFTKIILRDSLSSINSIIGSKKPKIIIYGAGRAGVYLLKTIIYESTYQTICFIDEDPQLWNRSINKVKIRSPEYIGKIHKNVDKVLLAITNLSPNKKKEISLYFKKYNLDVFEIPSFKDLLSGNFNLNNLKKIEININNLLGRKISINNFEENKQFANAVICISGAGGSIGSEICNQLLKYQPSNIVLIERNEFALYQIQKKLNKLNSEIKFHYILGDVCSENLLKKIFSEYKVDYMFHAAAYKHVPMVEVNPLQSIFNNVFSTKIICETAIQENLKKVILISTDKAVRPTNIMGASKRVAELIFQTYAEKNKKSPETTSNTIFSIVRFGNVLGSSGSVIPLFSEQIQSGGPITLTHKEIIRYFMTIEEAANLVLNTASLAKGGELFLLDMGKPTKIYSLAKQMIAQHGLTLKDENNKNGDIEIKITGLRPGEKLYEELLIGDNPQKTSNPKIFFAQEKFLDSKILFENLDKLFFAIEKMDIEASLKILSYLVPEWESSKK